MNIILETRLHFYSSKS